MTFDKDQSQAMHIAAALRWLAYHGKKEVTIDDVYGVYEILIPPKQKESRSYVSARIKERGQRWNVHRIHDGGNVTRAADNSTVRVDLYILSERAF